MRTITNKLLLTTMSLGLFLGSCSKEENLTSSESEITAVSAKASLKTRLDSRMNPNRFNLKESGLTINDFSIGSSMINDEDPANCGPTPFRGVLVKYDDLLWNSFLSVCDCEDPRPYEPLFPWEIPGLDWDNDDFEAYFIIFYDYFGINQIAALYENKNAGYFGARGEYTQYVKSRVRSLEKFWDMSGLVQVNGQHTATLEDLDFIRYVYKNYTSLPDAYIDFLLGIASHYNEVSNQIPENPFYASDGFATIFSTDGTLENLIVGSGVIVIGDGIVSMLAEADIDPNIVWSSILAHEWAHQIQFLNYKTFVYPVPAFIGTPESTRMTELEADFLTGYYLTHKRGATYNWKRVEGVLQSFFEIGDCGFASGGHHGTPFQRMAAAHAGYDLAASAQKNGKILSQQGVHDAFIEALGGIVGGATATVSNGENFE